MGRIDVLALGWQEDDMTLGAVKRLRAAERIILRTERCGAADYLRREGISFETFDALYDSSDDFDELAERVAEALYEAAQAGDVLYGVNDPGDQTAAVLMRLYPAAVSMSGGVSEGSALQIYAGGSFRQVGALDDFTPDASVATLVREIDTPILAGELKLRLTEVYPDETMIVMAMANGEIRHVPLWEMDRQKGYGHICCALIPAVDDLTQKSRFSFDDLCRIMRRLRAFDGDPWDIEQTHQSLRRYLIEEAYEAAEAIDKDDPDALYDELGDVLLQVVFHAEIGREHGEFDVSDVTTAICRKMIDRHPAVFSGAMSDDSAAWEESKMLKKGQSSHAEALEGVAHSLPALLRASKILSRAAAFGCQLPQAGGPDGEQAIGDAIFALAQCAVRAGIDPEAALSAATQRFIDRFAKLEQTLARNGRAFASLTAEEAAELWKIR